MRVFITVDTECTEERLINGKVRPPLGYDLMMRGRLTGAETGFGTDLIVRELGRFGFRATFFVETLCAEYFGIEGLAAVCADLQSADQDLQLHLHPNFRRPEWRRQGILPLPDNIADYTLSEQCGLLSAGLDLLVQAGVARASIVAFRAGNYGANNTTWEALRTVGLKLDSSLNLCYLGIDCAIVPDAPRIDLYQPIPGIWELPISCFRETSGYRHLEITAISFSEMRFALERLERQGVRTATIVTHPSEFFVIDDAAEGAGRPNRMNIRRLQKLLRFLDSARDRFQVTTVGELCQTLMADTDSAAASPIPSGSRLLRLARLPQQALKRLATATR